MIPTLHRYLGRDLVRTTALATLALTLIVTTFAVFEPLRREGLNAAQALTLFWYLLPVMLSLTLPISSVFAATFTYGRFAMDNELTACRASGVSRYALLKPGIVLGIVVGIATLLLSNWIAPHQALLGAETIKANLRGVLYQRLRAESHVNLGSWLLHADSVDPDNNQLNGIVVVNSRDEKDVSFYIASAASVDFSQTVDTTEVTVMAIHPAYGESTGFLMYESSLAPFGPIAVGERLKEKPALLDWVQLRDTLRDPLTSSEVMWRLDRIQRRLAAQRYYKEVAVAINDGRECDLVPRMRADDPAAGKVRYQFQAPAATIEKGKRLLLYGGEASDPSAQPVTVTRYWGTEKDRVYHCREVRLEVSLPGRQRWTRRDRDSESPNTKDEPPPPINVTLKDVTIDLVDHPAGTEPIRKGPEVTLEQLQMPSTTVAAAGAIPSLETLWRHPKQYPEVGKELDELRKHIKDRLYPSIVAEIHGRLAYGIGCMLLIPVGAALGLIYRGGDILAAFALCCAPALILVVMMIMGKQIISNPDTGPNAAAMGKMAIWSGVLLLGLLTAHLYGRVLRR